MSRTSGESCRSRRVSWPGRHDPAWRALRPCSVARPAASRCHLPAASRRPWNTSRPARAAPSAGRSHGGAAPGHAAAEGGVGEPVGSAAASSAFPRSRDSAAASGGGIARQTAESVCHNAAFCSNVEPGNDELLGSGWHSPRMTSVWMISSGPVRVRDVSTNLAVTNDLRMHHSSRTVWATHHQTPGSRQPFGDADLCRHDQHPDRAPRRVAGHLQP
jgi:hypothetical protein